jgi:hypothetical protein
MLLTFIIAHHYRHLLHEQRRLHLGIPYIGTEFSLHQADSLVLIQKITVYPKPTQTKPNESTYYGSRWFVRKQPCP